MQQILRHVTKNLICTQCIEMRVELDPLNLLQEWVDVQWNEAIQDVVDEGSITFQRMVDCLDAFRRLAYHLLRVALKALVVASRRVLPGVNLILSNWLRLSRRQKVFTCATVSLIYMAYRIWTMRWVVQMRGRVSCLSSGICAHSHIMLMSSSIITILGVAIAVIGVPAASVGLSSANLTLAVVLTARLRWYSGFGYWEALNISSPAGSNTRSKPSRAARREANHRVAFAVKSTHLAEMWFLLVSLSLVERLFAGFLSLMGGWGNSETPNDVGDSIFSVLTVFWVVNVGHSVLSAYVAFGSAWRMSLWSTYPDDFYIPEMRRRIVDSLSRMTTHVIGISLSVGTERARPEYSKTVRNAWREQLASVDIHMPLLHSHSSQKRGSRLMGPISELMGRLAGLSFFIPHQVRWAIQLLPHIFILIIPKFLLLPLIDIGYKHIFLLGTLNSATVRVVLPDLVLANQRAAILALTISAPDILLDRNGIIGSRISALFVLMCYTSIMEEPAVALATSLGGITNTVRAAQSGLMAIRATTLDGKKSNFKAITPVTIQESVSSQDIEPKVKTTSVCEESVSSQAKLSSQDIEPKVKTTSVCEEEVSSQDIDPKVKPRSICEESVSSQAKESSQDIEPEVKPRSVCEEEVSSQDIEPKVKTTSICEEEVSSQDIEPKVKPTSICEESVSSQAKESVSSQDIEPNNSDNEKKGRASGAGAIM